MILGFTGTRKGMTQRQSATVKYLFAELRLRELHHGGERHADAQAHRIAREMKVRIIVHPGLAFDAKFCPDADEIRQVKPGKTPAEQNIARNLDIATEGVDGLIAAPGGYKEEQRSGTWSTVRRARKLKRRRWLVFPDGTFREEPGE